MRSLISELLVILAAREEESIRLEHRVAVMELFFRQMMDKMSSDERQRLIEGTIAKVNRDELDSAGYDVNLLHQQIHKLLD
ncbi:anti-adapter protein IraP [Shimwellia pseudoproteus]|uniref:sigma-S stabilization anti-adapter protein IraP n=1 Tax=Shimwellia pseudoproteus TaxID=570012 RepID=UPI0018ED8DC2|nr:sigma-S stabilization anti-adapter protein IraP [Shimwellia pseudoproteus]MBJ3814758.1 anti-adapter protein IraP [Shimwellia pseudoproteus]